MKKFRHFLLATACLIGFASTAAHAWPSTAMRSDSDACQVPPQDVKVYDLSTPVEGFVKLDVQKPTVVEFFWYGCSHCAALQPSVKEWGEKDKSFTLVRIPAVAVPTPGSAWVTGAQIYYALVESGAFNESLHAKVFDAIHKDKKKILTDKEALRAFLSAQGLSFAAISKTMAALETPVVKGKVEQAAKATKEYKLSGTPTLVLNNRYEISPIESGGTTTMVPNMKKLIDWSVNRPFHCQSKR